MSTLLEKAMEAVHTVTRTGSSLTEELELALAYSEKTVGAKQVSLAAGVSLHNVNNWVGSTLVKAVRAGLIVRAKNGDGQ